MENCKFDSECPEPIDRKCCDYCCPSFEPENSPTGRRSSGTTGYNWVSVEDAMPDVIGEIFIVYDAQYDSVFQGVLTKNREGEKEFVSSFDRSRFADACITHWMSMPEPPQL